MATYGQWARSRRVSRVAWVCGPEDVLREEVVQAYRAAMPGAATWSGWHDEGEVWDQLLTQPPGPRLAVVRVAEKLHKAASLLPVLLGSGLETAFAVFVSSDDDFERAEGKLAPHLAALRDSRNGQLIRCCAPGKDEELYALIAGWWPGAGKNVARALTVRCGSDLSRVKAACGKAVAAGVEPSADMLDVVAPPLASGDFATFLVAGDKKRAMAAAAVLAGCPQAEAAQAIGLASSRVIVLSLLNDAAKHSEEFSDAARKLKIDPFIVSTLRKYVPAYDSRKVHRCLELLAMAESTLKTGARDGVLESVVALW